MGAVRRTDPRLDPDGGRTGGCKQPQRLSAAGLRGGRRHFAGRRIACGWRVFAALKRSLGAEVWIRSAWEWLSWPVWWPLRSVWIAAC